MTRLSNKEIQTIINDLKWCDECLCQLDQFFNGDVKGWNDCLKTIIGENKNV